MEKRDSFKKKELEKKKQKKQQDKKDKKEARKANSDKGTSFEDMLAYVDEDGNITSTPPDPTKKKTTFQLEDIQIGVSRQEDIAPEDSLRKGTVTFFNESKGFGFIKDKKTQESIFVHVNSLIDKIKENDSVTFEVQNTPKGLSALDVKLAK